MASKILQYLTPQEQTTIIDNFELFNSVSKVEDLVNFYLNQRGLNKKITYRGARSLIQELKPQAWEKYMELQRKKQELKDRPIAVLKEVAKEEIEDEKKPPREGPYPPMAQWGWLDDEDSVKKRKSHMKPFGERVDSRPQESVHIPDEGTC